MIGVVKVGPPPTIEPHTIGSRGMWRFHRTSWTWVWLVGQKQCPFLARRFCLVYGGKIVLSYCYFTTQFLGLSIICTFRALKALPPCNYNVFKMTMNILQSGSIHTRAFNKGTFDNIQTPIDFHGIIATKFTCTMWWRFSLALGNQKTHWG